MNKPFAWYGGKAALAPYLASLLPPHKVYCEVFGGSGAVLFAKTPSALEVFNDLDSGVVNFFRVLRNPEQAHALQEVLKLTPYAREEYYDCLEQWNACPDPVEKARAWYCAVMQSMNSSIRATGWSSTKMPDSNPARAWQNTIPHLAACVGRLAHIQIDHRDFETVLRAYDSPDTLFYLDPPYLPETRRKRHCYIHEMTPADHERLLSCIVQVKGMVLLSGYAHPSYQDMLASWECRSLKQFCSSAVRPDIAPEAQVRQECIWRNPLVVQRSQGLFPTYAAAWEEEVHS